MAVQFGSACFPSVVEAAQAAAAAAVGHVLPAGGSAYVVDAVPSGTGSIAYTLSEIGTSATITHTSTLTFPPCVLLGAADAAEAGWLVVAAWVAVWALLTIRRALV